MENQFAKDLTSLFIDRGFNPVIGTIYQQQEYWLSWYRGNVDGFHNVVTKNVEGTTVKVLKSSLQMAKKVSEDITSLLFNEKVTLSVSNPTDETEEDKITTAQEALDKVLEDNYFTDEMVNFVELTCVFGTGVTVEYLVNDETKINFLFGNRVIVIDYDNTTIKAIAVIQQFSRAKMKYTHVMYHTYTKQQTGSDFITNEPVYADKKTYRITHEMYSTKENNKGLGKPAELNKLFDEEELGRMRHIENRNGQEVEVYYVEYDSEPHFQVFKLGISNNYDVRSPMGISAYANSVDTLENIDEKYYSSKMDSINSRKRIFVDDEASKVAKRKDATGNLSYVKYFDANDTQFQSLKGMTGDGSKKAIEVYSPDYDSMQHDTTIQFELNLLSSKTMLGRNYYSFENGAVGYQNELNVIASNSDTFRNRNKNINKLKEVLIGLMKSIMFLERENGNYTGTLELEYDVQFDDDIMTDDATKLAQLRLDMQDGLVPEYMYMMKAYNITEDEAREILRLAEEDDDYTEPENEVVPPTEEPDDDDVDA